MSAFTKTGVLTQYHYVQHSNDPRYPYGLCGPFATESEAVEAMERITAVFPATECHVEDAGFAGDKIQMLTTANAKARQRLDQLRA